MFYSILSKLAEVLVHLKSLLATPSKDPIKPMPEPIPEPIENLNSKLVRIADALTLLNIDVTPKDKIPDEVACSESLCEVINKVCKFPIIPYTPDLVRTLKLDSRFEGTLDFNEATIIVSPTGTGNGSIVGHCGVIGTNNEIISNNSRTGKWEYNFTIDSWKARYSTKGGLKLLLFRFKD